MQKRALIAMQYSALHHRTWITPTVQKPCTHGLQNKKAMKSFDFTAFSGAPQQQNPNFFPIGEGFGFFVFFGKQNESLASIEKRPRPNHKKARQTTVRVP